MEREKKYIGFDLGAESGRCVVGQLKNNKLTLNEIHRFTTHNILYTQGFHWDILAIFEELIRGLSLAYEQFGNPFDGISIDTWGVDYVLLDKDNRILGYPYHYRDSRTDGIIEASYHSVPKEKLYQITGIQILPFNTVFQLSAEKRQKSSLLSIADQVLLIPDFLLFLLTGVKRGEYTIVSTTSLNDANTRSWAWELIKSYGFPDRIFPDVVEPGYCLGSLLPEIVKKTGITKDTPVIAAAGHDTAAAVAAIPASLGSWAYLSSGTWSLMGKELPAPLITDQGLAYNFTNEGGVENTIRFHKNIIGLWPIQECRRAWQAAGNVYDYPDLVRLAHDYGPAHAWIDVDEPRFLRAGDMPNKIVSFLKETQQPHNNDIGFITRCVLESLAFKYRQTIAELEEVTANKIDRLHAVGGGIQNELLTQLTADALGMEVIAGPVEGTIVGNIGVQAIATGALENLHELRKVVANSFDLQKYSPENSDYFNDNEKKYKKIIKNAML